MEGEQAWLAAHALARHPPGELSLRVRRLASSLLPAPRTVCSLQGRHLFPTGRTFPFAYIVSFHEAVNCRAHLPEKFSHITASRVRVCSGMRAVGQADLARFQRLIVFMFGPPYRSLDASRGMMPTSESLAALTIIVNRIVVSPFSLLTCCSNL